MASLTIHGYAANTSSNSIDIDHSTFCDRLVNLAMCYPKWGDCVRQEMETIQGKCLIDLFREFVKQRHDKAKQLNCDESCPINLSPRANLEWEIKNYPELECKIEMKERDPNHGSIANVSSVRFGVNSFETTYSSDLNVNKTTSTNDRVERKTTSVALQCFNKQ